MSKTHKPSLGPYLRKLRDARNLSLRKAQKLTGVSYVHLRALEQGKHTPSPATLAKLARGYGADPSDLLERCA